MASREAITGDFTLENSIRDASEGLQQEMSLLQSVASGELSSGYLIWRSHPSIVVPRSLANKPEFEKACDFLKNEKWPVVVRATGGDLSPLAPGLINVALAFQQSRYKEAIRDSYMKLCTPLIGYLQGIGVEAYCASVKGAFCDGDFNIVVAGRKLAGTAQRWRKMDSNLGKPKNQYAVLAHAVMLIDEDLSKLWTMGNAFYHYCGIDNYIKGEQHVSLAELMPSQEKSLLKNCLADIREYLEGYLAVIDQQV
jgi:lipoate-protein ligase A